jgi:flagellar basal-body rod modification protein FlgD
MSALSSASALASSPITTASGENVQDRYSALTSGDFLKIMLQELSRQDPLKPNDTGALVEQMASIREIQSDLDMSKKLESIVSQNELASAGSLIGARVSGVTETGRRVTGVVDSVSRTADGPVLSIGPNRLPFGGIDRIEQLTATSQSAS